MATTTLIISTRNRPLLLRETLVSAINQSKPFDQIIISDNSYPPARHKDNVDALDDLLKQSSGKIKLLPTRCDLKSGEHTTFQQKHYIGGTDYCVLFHDDDLMEPNYHEELLAIVENHAEVAAVACNARYLHEGDLSRSTLMRTRKGTATVSGPKDLLSYYLDISPVGAPPLCSYLYRTSVLQELEFGRHLGGKYSDVSVLMQLAEHGLIRWICNPLVQYRVHAGQDSSEASTRDYRSLLNHLTANGSAVISKRWFEMYRLKHFRLKLPSLANKPTKARTYRRLLLLLSVGFTKKIVTKPDSLAYFWKRLIRT